MIISATSQTPMKSLLSKILLMILEPISGFGEVNKHILKNLKFKEKRKLDSADTIKQLIRLKEIGFENAEKNYVKNLNKSIDKAKFKVYNELAFSIWTDGRVAKGGRL